ncbi:MAG: hypothetical protein MJB14_10600 [Spirochaetes bacterium]|nr:hypothetical protein [Spirochaetota bacterium]
MNKNTFHRLLIQLFILIILFNCGKKEQNSAFSQIINVETLDSNIYIRKLTVINKENHLKFYYPDETTVSMKQGIFQNGQFDTAYIDDIDTDSRLNPIIGKNFYFQDDQEEKIFYYDVQNEKKSHIKILTKKKEDELFQTEAIPLKLQDMEIIQYSGQYLIVYYDKQLKMGLINGDKIEDFTIKFYQSLKIEQISALTDGKNIYLFILDKEKNLWQTKISLNFNNKIAHFIEQNKIAKEVSLYQIKLVQSIPHILLYQKNHQFNYFYAQEKKTIGYIYAINQIHLFFYKNQPVFLYVDNDYQQTVEMEKADKDLEITGNIQYNLNIIYPKSINKHKTKWIEEKILTQPSPILTMAALGMNDSTHLITGGIDLKLIQIKNKDFNSLLFPRSKDNDH